MKLSISSEKLQSNADMSLDDIIKKKKTQKPGRGRGGQKNTRGTLRGTARGGVNKQTRRPNQNQNQNQQFNRRGSFGQQRTARPMNRQQAGGQVAAQGMGKLELANLDFGVTDADIRELFSEFGLIKTAAVHYGSNGVSLGTAHVHFARHGSALAALNRYNGVHLDGRPMRIAMKGGSSAGPVHPVQRGGGVRNMGQRRPMGRQFQNQNQNQNQNQGGNRKPQRGGGRGRGRGGARGGRGGGEPKKPMTAEQLDAQLEAYANQSK